MIRAINKSVRVPVRFVLGTVENQAVVKIPVVGTVKPDGNISFNVEALAEHVRTPRSGKGVRS